MIKAYFSTNMHNDLTQAFTKSDVLWRLREKAIQVRSTQQLDEKVVEVKIDIPNSEIKEYPRDKTPDDLEPGLYRTSSGFLTFKGDPTLFKEVRTVVKANLDDPKIPRVTVIVVIEDPEQLKGPYWWNAPLVKSAVDRFKPKWVCKGYIHSIVGTDKVRIDYVPVAVNESVLTNIITNLVAALSPVVDQLEEVFDDHGSNQEFDLLDHIF